MPIFKKKTTAVQQAIKNEIKLLEREYSMLISNIEVAKNKIKSNERIIEESMQSIKDMENIKNQIIKELQELKEFIKRV